MPSASASCSWLIAGILRRIRTRLPTCWSVGSGTFFRGNGKRTAMADRWLKLLSKNRPDAGTFDIPIQRAIFGQGPRNIMPIARDYSRASQCGPHRMGQLGAGGSILQIEGLD